MGWKEIKPCLGMFELCFNKSFNFHKQVQLEIWPLLLSAFVPHLKNRNSSTGSQGYMGREISPPCRSSSIKASHKSKSILVSTARSQKDFSEIFSFLTIRKNEIIFLKKLAFQRDIHKVHGVQTNFPKLVYYMCFPNGELNVFIFTCKTVFT